MMRPTKGIIFIIISALMFGSYGLWSKLLGDSFDPFYQGWTRGFILAVFLLPILIFNKQIVLIKRKDWKWLSVFLFFTSLTQAPLYYAFNHMDIGSATLLFFVSYALTMYLFGLVFLNEKLTKLKIIALVIALIGMYIVFSFSFAVFSLLAALLAIVNGIASGGEISSSKKLSGNYSPLYLSWLSWVIIFISNLAISLIIGETQHMPALNRVWLFQIGYTIASVLGFWLVIKGLQQVEASVAGLIGLLEIVFSVLLGIFIFHEQLNLKIILGGILIIIAAALPHLHNVIKIKRKTKH